MNQDRVEGNWKELKGKIRQKWGKLTDDELEETKGKEEEIVGKIQSAYGHTKDAAKAEYYEWKKALSL